MPGAFGQNGGSIKLVNDAYVLGLGRGPYAKPSGQRPDSARLAVRPWPTGPSPGIRTCLVPGSPFPPIQTVTSKLSLSTVTRYNINALYLGEPEDPPRAREVAHANHDAGGSGGRRRPGLSRMQQRAPRA